MNAIKTEGLTYKYGIGTPFEKTAINNINIEIKQGDFVSVIGHTGSGKSTLIQHLNGLIKPTDGKVYINGKDIWEKGHDIRSTRFEVGVVFQYPEYQLFEETVYKDIAFGPKNMGLSEEEIHRRVCESAAFAGIDEKLFLKSPFELSGGQKRRVAIAGILAMTPKILICDEPSAGLDPYGREKIYKVIKNYRKAYNATIIIVSHSMEEVAKYADNILVLNKGEVYAFDTVHNIFSRGEEMRSIGLSVPQVTEAFIALNKIDSRIPKDIYNIQQGAEVLIPFLKKGGDLI